MNDRHPSGIMTTPAPASDASTAYHAPYGTQEASYGDPTTCSGYDTTGFTGHPTSASAFHSDPLFGGLPNSGLATGSYDTAQWSTGTESPRHDSYGSEQHTVYDVGAHASTTWTVPAQATGNDVSGQWDAGTWLHPDQPAGTDPTQQWDWGTQAFDTGAYDATQWNSGSQFHAADPEQSAEPFGQQATATVGQDGDPQGSAVFERAPYEDTAFGEPVPGEDERAATGELSAVTGLPEDRREGAPAPAPRAGRSRRRTPAKRSALLTIAVPSACVVGVTGIAAASVGALTDDSKDTTASAPDAHAVQPSAANSELDSQLKTLSAGAHDFADRASRTQDRIDLKAQQALEKKKAAAEAALRERLRPKFALPVTQKGLSAYFGQAGVNWMSVHTGIDFPVSYGTTVMAATDGTVSTKWNSAYGNMMIVTAKDGTQTWYCHLSHYRVASGATVKAGQPIAYSGNSGNSTGPHLHFEVRPAGGAAVDPLPWLRSHGLDPT
ncbi:M23 family peptidase [Streptomyces pluripotens]|uniref:M23 family peptidase n=1 Tax=Streptomyces pluripotens TaxID=1355015 RepID=A0A221P249_9ACTN|nr:MULTISPECIES: M23 family metallopeptidase [Streptomyces]ARP71892.1 peptidase M23 [Streptomyces pluripotens]ASN26138.1 M23 family peptidase [Streptomyces pluripotens]KIE26308.1 peptidase M23 [Streptomyces sp. MUSC 125]